MSTSSAVSTASTSDTNAECVESIKTSSKLEVKPLKCSYTWTINNFTFNTENTGEARTSPIFSDDHNEEIKWCLKIYPNGIDVENKNCVSLYLHSLSCNNAVTKLKYKFAIIDYMKQKTHYREKEVDYEDSMRVGFDKYCTKIPLIIQSDRFTPDGKLTILCEVEGYAIVQNLSAPQDRILYTDTWSSTQLNIVKLSHMWTINNFSYCRDDIGDVMKSPKFLSENNDEIECCLLLYPNGRREEDEGYVSLYLQLSSSIDIDLKVRLKISIINSKRKKANEKGQSHVFVSDSSSSSIGGYDRYIKRDFLFDKANEILSDDKLTILCELSFVGNVVNDSGQRNKSDKAEIPKCRLSEDLENLLESERLSDVTLVVEDKELLAHKAILAARCPAFSAMFKDETAQRRTNRVEITDVGYEVLKEVLRFIYTGTTTNLDAIAKDLLPAANKYALEKLKFMCELSLSTRLQIDNATEMLIFADENNAERLKEETVDFINAHATEVMDTEPFKLMFVKHPQLIAEVALKRLLALKKPENSNEFLLFDNEQK